MKIGLFGGSFNPIHNSHIKVIKEILRWGAVDEVWIIPCRNHAFSKGLLDAGKRIEMIELAINGLKNVRIEKIELDSKEISYTINSVRTLKEKYPQHEFFLIIGSDIIDEIPRWHKYEELLEEIDIFVFKRSKADVSSTKIRKLLGNKNKISRLVPKVIEDYIIKNGLYS